MPIFLKDSVGAAAYGRLKEFEREITILEELLAQPGWRRGKRGAWYDRWALILMHHLVRKKRDGQLIALAKDHQKAILEQAIKIIIRGLEDEDMHIGMSTDLPEVSMMLTKAGVSEQTGVEASSF